MKNYDIYSKIFCGKVGSGKTTSIINDLRKLITKYPDIKIFIMEAFPEIKDGIKDFVSIENISTTLNDDIDLIVVGDYVSQNIPISLLTPYIYDKPIWFELKTAKELEVINHKYKSIKELKLQRL